MKEGRFLIAFLILCSLLLGCERNPSEKIDTEITGVITSLHSEATVTVLQQGIEKARTIVNPANGTFSVRLTDGGVYDVKISLKGQELPLFIYGVEVEKEEVKSLGTFNYFPSQKKGTLYGEVTPPLNGTSVTVYREREEKASINANPDGTFVIENLDYGEYDIRITSEGYHDDSVPGITLSEGSKDAEIKTLLLYKTDIDGVDWGGGHMSAKGLGKPPKESISEAQARIMARRAAVVDGYRNLLSVMKEISLGPHSKICNVLEKVVSATRVEGFIRGATVVSERYLEDGSCEVTLTLPLTGSRGVSEFIRTNRKEIRP